MKKLPALLIISGKEIEHKYEARFLGVILDENLTWARHISSLRYKMARYIGKMYIVQTQVLFTVTSVKCTLYKLKYFLQLHR